MPGFSDNPITKVIRGLQSRASFRAKNTAHGRHNGRSVEASNSESRPHLAHLSSQRQRTSSFVGRLFHRQQISVSDNPGHYEPQSIAIGQGSDYQDDDVSGASGDSPYYSDAIARGGDVEITTPKTLSEQLESEMAVRPIGDFQASGHFGSVKMVLPNDDKVCRPIDALKVTLGKENSRESEILKQLQRQPHKNVMGAKGVYKGKRWFKIDEKEGVAEAFRFAFIGQNLKDVLKPDKKLDTHSTHKMKQRLAARKSRRVKRPKMVLLGGGLPPVLLVQVTRGIARALNHLHNVAQPAIIHMDLNPGNILISADGTVKLTDFGCSLYQATANNPGENRQFPILYSAPEVLLGMEITPQADMWALGCLLYEAATGQRLCRFLPCFTLTGAELHAALKGFATRALNHPRLKRPEHAVLKDLLTRLLVMEPSDRITAAQALCHSYLQPK